MLVAAVNYMGLRDSLVERLDTALDLRNHPFVNHAARDQPTRFRRIERREQLAVLVLDALDVALLTALRERPHTGALELSRMLGVARATVSARIERLESDGIVTGYGPDIDVAAAGFGIQAFVTLEIAQGAIDAVQRDLEAIPGVIEAHTITGSGDVLCRIAASSHDGLQQALVELNRSKVVVRSTSVIALTEVVRWRTLPLLASAAHPSAGRSSMARPAPSSSAVASD